MLSSMTFSLNEDVNSEIKDNMHTFNIVPSAFTTYDPVDKIVLATEHEKSFQQR